MPKFYHGGVYEPPDEIADLPFDLLRAHGYPRHPGRVARSITTAGRLRPESVLMPQRMAFTRWKDEEGGQEAFGENARSAMLALGQGPDQVGTIYNAAGIPVATVTSPHEDARDLGLTRLPDPGFDDEIEESPVPRGVLPEGRMQVTAAELNRMVRNQEVRAMTGDVAISTKLSRALQSVDAQRAALGMMLATDEDLPWYLR